MYVHIHIYILYIYMYEYAVQYSYIYTYIYTHIYKQFSVGPRSVTRAGADRPTELFCRNLWGSLAMEFRAAQYLVRRMSIVVIISFALYASDESWYHTGSVCWPWHKNYVRGCHPRRRRLAICGAAATAAATGA